LPITDIQGRLARPTTVTSRYAFAIGYWLLAIPNEHQASSAAILL
jgi:hypothetical protein